MRTIRKAVLTALAVAACGAVGAQTARVALDIKPQPMRAALKALGEQAGLQILFRAEDVAAGGAAPAVIGQLSIEDALEKLLTSSGLKYEFVNERTVRIAAKQPMSTSGVMSDNALGQEDDLWSRFLLAQSDSSPSSSMTSSDGEGAAGRAAKEGRGEGERLEEVIVTAQRREEKLLETPVSIGVLTGEYLDRSSARSVNDVLTQVGGVSIIETRPGESQIVVRGVLSALDAGTSAVGYYLDEIPFSFINSGRLPDTNSFDLSRIEVLRGPQGTLYGANAVGGVVRILTEDANLDEFQAKARLRASHTEEGGGNGSGDVALNMPLIEGKLAVRGVAGYSNLSGFIDSSSDGGEDINSAQSDYQRLKFNFHPFEQLSLELGLMRSRIHSDAPTESLPDLTTMFSSDQNDDQVLEGYNLTAEYQWTDVSLLSATSYLDYGGGTNRELIFLPSRFWLPYQTGGQMHSFSQEFRLLSNLSGAWRWSAGAFFRNISEAGFTQAAGFGVSKGKTTSESFAVFGEATRLFADDKVELTAGARYFEDSIEGKSLSAFFNGPLDPPTKADFDKVTWRALLAYKPRQDAMLYGSVATGFRSGKPQFATARAIVPDLPDLQPDSLMTYELGAKGRLGGSLTYETALYYTDWKDIQESFTVPGGFIAVLNAGDAAGPGFDASLSYQPIRGLTLDASIGWNDLHFSQDILATAALVQLFEKDSRVNNSPAWTGSVGGNYRAAAGMTNVDLVVTTNYAYGSGRLARALNDTTVTRTESDAFGVLNASIGLETGDWTLALFGDNLLNGDAAIGTPIPGLDLNAIRQRPRTIGLQATFGF